MQHPCCRWCVHTNHATSAPFTYNPCCNHGRTCVRARSCTFLHHHCTCQVLSQFQLYLAHGELYINELMVKKFSLLGATALICSKLYFANAMDASGFTDGLTQKRTSSSNAFPALLQQNAPVLSMGTAKSAVALAGRLLMSSLFLYVGYHEIAQQMDSVVAHDGHQHRCVSNDIRQYCTGRSYWVTNT